MEPFQEPVGPTFPISPSPAEVFGYFFTSAICDHIVQQSSQVMEVRGLAAGIESLQTNYEHTLGFASAWVWYGFQQYVTTGHEIPLFLNHQLQMGSLATGSHYLHLVDNTTLPSYGEPAHDRLGKVRPVLDLINHQVLENY